MVTPIKRITVTLSTETIALLIQLRAADTYLPSTSKLMSIAIHALARERGLAPPLTNAPVPRALIAPALPLPAKPDPYPVPAEYAELDAEIDAALAAMKK